MLIPAVISALLLAAPAQASVPQAQEPSSAPATDLEDIVVEGRRLEEVTQDFVREVGAPAGGRGLARWRSGVCVGVANLQNDAAQYIADRVSTVAQDLGLRVGDPGCEPSILIVATQDANAFTPQFVASRPRLFIVGGTGMDRGRDALRPTTSPSAGGTSAFRSMATPARLLCVCRARLLAGLTTGIPEMSCCLPLTSTSVVHPG